MVRPPGVGGACATSGGTRQEYGYDEADRLIGTGLTYDAWGRITKLPAEFAGGKILETEYFANNMVASQTEKGGVTNSYELRRDRASAPAHTGRWRRRAPKFSTTTARATRPPGRPLDRPGSGNIAGIGGELAAVQESTGTVTFELTDLHGDVVASASSSPTVTQLLATYRFDEFGEPEFGSAGRFGWLGGNQRRTELAWV